MNDAFGLDRDGILLAKPPSKVGVFATPAAKGEKGIGVVGDDEVLTAQGAFGSPHL
jgi:hypothetical protein